MEKEKYIVDPKLKEQMLALRKFVKENGLDFTSTIKFWSNSTQVTLQQVEAYIDYADKEKVVVLINGVKFDDWGPVCHICGEPIDPEGMSDYGKWLTEKYNKGVCLTHDQDKYTDTVENKLLYIEFYNSDAGKGEREWHLQQELNRRERLGK